MKFSLVVCNAGKGQGKVIPIPVSPFLVGRDSQCHLRPASPLISKRHCALSLKGNKAFVRDFDSTNGTFVNDRQVKGEIELRDEDRLQLGPLRFQVRLEAPVSVSTPTPLPPTKRTVEEEDIAGAWLLGSEGEGDAATSGREVDSEGVPTGSTVLEMLPPQDLGAPPPPEPVSAEQKKAPYKPASAPQPMGDTTEAAKQILDKYLRRTRS